MVKKIIYEGTLGFRDYEKNEPMYFGGARAKSIVLGYDRIKYKSSNEFISRFTLMLREYGDECRKNGKISIVEFFKEYNVGHGDPIYGDIFKEISFELKNNHIFYDYDELRKNKKRVHMIDGKFLIDNCVCYPTKNYLFIFCKSDSRQYIYYGTLAF